MKRLKYVLASLCFLICEAVLSQVQPKNIYYFKVQDKNTREPIPFANIIVKENDSIIGKCVTGLDGTAQIALAREMNKATVVAAYIGYRTRQIAGVSAKPGYTVEMMMDSAPQYFDEIVVQAYTEPLVDPDIPEKKKKRWWQKEEIVPPKPPELLIEYNRQELAARDALVNGFTYPDSISCTRVEGRSFKVPIKYPESARKAGIAEKFFIKITYKNGIPVKAISLKGSDPALSLEVYKFLMMKICFKSSGREDVMDMIMPIVFRLR